MNYECRRISITKVFHSGRLDFMSFYKSYQTAYLALWLHYLNFQSTRKLSLGDKLWKNKLFKLKVEREPGKFCCLKFIAILQKLLSVKGGPDCL
jgi:hypothetical protein